MCGALGQRLVLACYPDAYRAVHVSTDASTCEECFCWALVVNVYDLALCRARRWRKTCL